MAKQSDNLKQEQKVADCELGSKDNGSPCARKERAKTLTLSLLTIVSLLLLGGIFYLNLSGRSARTGASTLCQPCQASSECGPLEQHIASTGLSALVFGSDRSMQFAMECRANFCVPSIFPKHEAVCQPSRTSNPVDIEIFEGRSGDKISSRKLHMAQGAVRSGKKQRRLQRIRNDKFTEYFQARALGSESGGHGYLGVNYSHSKEE